MIYFTNCVEKDSDGEMLMVRSEAQPIGK